MFFRVFLRMCPCVCVCGLSSSSSVKVTPRVSYAGFDKQGNQINDHFVDRFFTTRSLIDEITFILAADPMHS